MRIGVISDIHGVGSALNGTLADGRNMGVDLWWALGDLVLFGPDPVQVLEILHGLENVSFVGGNTDRYVLTDDQPRHHLSPEAAMQDVDLVRRYGLMAAGSAWTRGVLDQAGVLGLLEDLPDQQQIVLPGGTTLLGVHASPVSDDGPGIDTTSSDQQLAALLEGTTADWVVGGHTHDPTDRRVGSKRALNCGSVGLPREQGIASWLFIDATKDEPEVQHRGVAFDTAAVVAALERRRHPNRAFVDEVLHRGTFV